MLIKTPYGKGFEECEVEDYRIKKRACKPFS